MNKLNWRHIGDRLDGNSTTNEANKRFYLELWNGWNLGLEGKRGGRDSSDQNQMHACHIDKLLS